jgi:hypothetical protein
VNLADDLLYLCLFTRWFGGGEYSHRFTKVLWFGMAIWVSPELTTRYQTIKYSLANLIPGVPRPWALALYVGGQLSVFAFMLFFLNLVNDPILLLAITSNSSRLWPSRSRCCSGGDIGAESRPRPHG